MRKKLLTNNLFNTVELCEPRTVEEQLRERIKGAIVTLNGIWMGMDEKNINELSEIVNVDAQYHAEEIDNGCGTFEDFESGQTDMYEWLDKQIKIIKNSQDAL